MFNVQLAKAFIKHRIVANTRHGIHSPFVYKLIDEVIYDFNPQNEYTAIEQLREKLLKDETAITITDLGAGSHVNNNKQKKVREIAKNALKPASLAKLIYRLVKEFKPRNIVELGTCLGITTSYMATAAPKATLTTIEGCPETAAVARKNISSLGLNNVEVQIGNFDTLFPEVLNTLETLDFLFIDGNHRKQATIDYFQQALSKINEDSVIIFDDIYWSKGMEEAWEEIKQHEAVTVSVDLFWIGLVFFRKGQAKEHFKVRF